MSALPRTVLCVDDDADDLLFITTALQQADPMLHTAVAGNGVEALAYLEEAARHNNLPLLVILDINMPRMDGRQTLATLKRDPRFASLPVVMFSTSASPVDRLFCERYQTEMVTKPCSYAEVLSVVQGLFRHARHCP